MQDAFDRLVALMARLRSPGGCPWDRAQTHQSLKPFLIEECYEVIDALDEGDPGKIREELGDLLFQIIFQARIAEENGWFTIRDVLETNIEKMTRRHPHVFGDARLSTEREVLANWEEIKKREGGREGRESILDGVPRDLPALLRAQRLQERAGRVGFDWPDLKEVVPKLDEEMAEFRQSLARDDADGIEEELGDLLFVLVNISRFLCLNPEEALRKTIGKFTARFRYVEQAAAAAGRRLSDMTGDERERLWQEAKEQEKRERTG